MSRRETIPSPDAFRCWLRQALPVVSTSAAALGRDVGLGKNTLGDFLGTPGRDLQLGTAAAVHRALVERATAAGVDLPQLQGAAHG